MTASSPTTHAYHAGGGRKRLPGQGGDGQENELPMLGIGLQYSLIGKKPEDMSMGSMSGMNGKDMFMPMLKISLPIFRKQI